MARVRVKCLSCCIAWLPGLALGWVVRGGGGGGQGAVFKGPGARKPDLAITCSDDDLCDLVLGKVLNMRLPPHPK